MKAEVTREHEWLKQLVGDWTYTVECVDVPDVPPQTHQGRETVRMFGDVWMRGESRMEMDGGAVDSVITLGYDTAKKKFVGSWISTVMTSMFRYEGELDASGKVLPLNTRGPSMTDAGKEVEYQDVIEIRSKDERALWSQMKMDDGTWMRFMTAVYRRVGT
jgi:hypothetical protein